MPSAMSKKGLDKGLITQKQYDKLPSHLLDAIVNSKMKKMGGGKPKPMKKAVKKPVGPRVAKPLVDNRKKPMNMRKAKKKPKK